MGSQTYSRPVREMKSIQDVDNIMGNLQARCKEWRALSIKKKVALLKAIRARALKASSKLGEATAKVRAAPQTCHAVLRTELRRLPPA